MPHYFFKEGNIIPGLKERDQTDKVKVKGKKTGGGTIQQRARRVMTAKLKKELAQRKRDGGGPAAEIPRDNFTDTASTTSTTNSASADSGAGAVEQVEQTTQDSAAKAGRSIKRGVSLAVSKMKQGRQKIKERQNQPSGQGQPPDTPSAQAPVGHETVPPADTPPHQGRTTDGGISPSPPTPGERMRQRAADQRKEQFTHPRTATAKAGRGEVPASSHYGGASASPGPSTQKLPAGDQSIHPSIKERPRRSAVLKEKPQAGAIQPKTRRAAEQTTSVSAGAIL